jgi:hypothetical protein
MNDVVRTGKTALWLLFDLGAINISRNTCLVCKNFLGCIGSLFS